MKTKLIFSFITSALRIPAAHPDGSLALTGTVFVTCVQLEYVPERIAPVYVSFYPKMKNIPKNKSGDRLLSSRLKKIQKCPAKS